MASYSHGQREPVHCSGISFAGKYCYNSVVFKLGSRLKEDTALLSLMTGHLFLQPIDNSQFCTTPLRGHPL